MKNALRKEIYEGVMPKKTFHVLNAGVNIGICDFLKA